MNVHIEIYLMRYHVGSCVNASVLDGKLRLSNNYDVMNNTDKKKISAIEIKLPCL